MSHPFRPKLLAQCISVALISLATTGGARAAGPTEEAIAKVQVSSRHAADGSAASGYRSSSASAGVLGQGDLKDTPYSINVTSNAMIEALQAQSVAEALRYNPTVNAGSGANSVGGGAAFQIRGFVTDTNESFIDGMRIYSRTPLEDKQSIEVLNGAAALLYGFASPAGVVNYVLKRPTAERLARLTVGDYGGEQYFVHGDFGGRLDEAGHWGYRLNLLGVNDGETSVHNQHHGRTLLSAALEGKLSPDTVWSFDVSRSQVDIKGGDDIFTLGSKLSRIPDAPAADRNYMPAYSVAEDGYTRLASALNMRLDERFALRAQLGYSDVTMYRHRASDKIIDDAGDYTMSRNYYNAKKLTTGGSLALDAHLRTGSVEHSLTLAHSEEWTTYKYAAPYANQNIAFSGTSNLYSPIPWPDDKAGATVGKPDRTTERNRLAATTLADRITFNRRWSVLAGASLSAITDQNWDCSGYLASGACPEKPEYAKHRATPSLALIFSPSAGLSTYLSYSEALQKGPTAPSTAANANETLAPYLSRQIELGAKSTLGEIDVNVALFGIDKANAQTDPQTNLYSEDGREIHWGGELVLAGRASRELTVGGGLSLLHAYVDQTSSASLVGKVPQGVPERTARLFAEYSPLQLPGLSLQGGLSYTGRIYVDAANTLPLNPVVTGDAGIRYQSRIAGRDTTLRLTVSNVTNKNYWVSSGSSLALGAPRNTALSIATAF